ncbi:MAG: two-component sensor histidine kinase [Alphaproteobacteria bacterium]|nr:two-component sensor histidine kinase [Alphaproteobacteria bacterium]
MHLRLSPKIENKLSYWRLKYLPRTLFFRTMLLIFVPLIVVQIVSVVMFFDGSWSRMGRKLSESLAAEIAIIVNQAQQKNIDWKSLQNDAVQFFGIRAKVLNSENSSRYNEYHENKIVLGFLERELIELFPKAKTWTGISKDGDTLLVSVKYENVTYEFTCPKKRIFSSSVFMFVVWMVGTSILLFLVAVLFLRIQVRAISDLAIAAENFGKGIDDKNFKPYGSVEVRKAAIAFIKMKERIQRQISERTQMLAGVSHDLRTPLTRMKLQASMLIDENEKSEFLSDIDEMEKMLNGYLAFVKGETGENSININMSYLMESVVNKFKLLGVNIDFQSNCSEVVFMGREQALRRAISNIISNASKYGKNIGVVLTVYNKSLEIIVEDDGPGIPEEKREDVFKAFYRLEESRNKETGGVGLGLSIAKDVVTSHGGSIKLDGASLGGLKVIINIPL